MLLQAVMGAPLAEAGQPRLFRILVELLPTVNHLTGEFLSIFPTREMPPFIESGARR